MGARWILMVGAAAALAAVGHADAATDRGGAWSFISEPGLHPPSVRVTANRAGTAPGYVFVAPIPGPQRPGRFAGQEGPAILDGSGRPVWANPLAHRNLAFDFRTQTYRGQPVLTWWQGHLKPQGWGRGTDVVVDSSYRRIARIRSAGGWRPDIHEFLITPRGRALITAYKPHRTSFARFGGPHKRGVLLESVVEEVDIRTGKVLFRWNPLGEVSLRESRAIPVKDQPWDAFHLNSADVDAHGNLLVSARNTWTLYKVSRRTGRIAWRLGGRHSSFRMGRATRFAYQHDARFRGGSTVSLFDNEGAPPVRGRSRAVVLQLDRGHRRVGLVRQYPHPSGGLAGSQGNLQLLPNGNAFTGWGAEPSFSEFSPTGALLFDAHFHGPGESYRAYRKPWVGHPRRPPAIAVRGSTVYASWNGATEVASWQVLAGPSAGALSRVGAAPRDGFETAMTVQSEGPFFAVRALDSGGRTLGTSKPTRPSSVDGRRSTVD
ncbi:MAG: arylsulfotransferase family protein [Thermoleophilaceae bacterium]